ncbi:hypothetical protein [Paenibacillus chungangensis]|uniref:Zorya protein ZorC EH domain-containing protein n=1 Tax=Paenibacillus chungangensis TaxID=696535 RepID=A0ABW3HST7_9BACL
MHRTTGSFDEGTVPANKLTELKRKFELIYPLGPDEFSEFTADLSAKDEKLVIYLYHATMTPEWKSTIKAHLLTSSQRNKRLFRSSLDIMYDTDDSQILWDVIQAGYKQHQERLEKRIEPSDRIRWRKFVLADDPVDHLNDQIRQSESSMVDTAETYLLKEYHAFFKRLFFEVVMKADESFFLKEKTLFEKIFQRESNHMQQFLAHHCIRNCPNLDRVRDIGYIIYDVMSSDRQNPMLWREVGDEEKERFADWIFGKQLDDFFNQVSSSSERAAYWRKFAPMLRDMEVTDNKTTIIMYFERHVIIEVLTVGAVYIYEREVFNQHFQQKIDHMREERERLKHTIWGPQEVKREKLLNKDLIVTRNGSQGWLRHYSDWQSVFDRWLRDNLGWEVSEHVLQQKKRTRH